MSELLYLKLYKKIEEEIASGRLLPYDRLPSKRALAATEGVSLNTVITAYELLAKNGLIVTAERKGYYVAGDDGGRSFAGAPWSRPSTRKYIFSINSNGITTLTRKLIKAQHDAGYELERRLLSYKEYTGSSRLRESICEYLYKTRRISCNSEQIITASGINGLMSICRRLLGDIKYGFEDPTEKRAEFALTAGKNIVTVPTGADGADIGTLVSSDAQAFFCMPEKQYPTGCRMSLEKRHELLDRYHDERYILEYGLCSELCFGAPLPSLYELDDGRRVIYINTFDKITAPGITLAYMVLPEPLIALFKERLWYHHSNVSEYDSLLVSEFISNGGIYSNIKRLRRLYEKKCRAALEEFKDLAICDRLSFTGTEGGTFFSLGVETGKTGGELMALAAAKDVKLLPISCYNLIHDHSARIFAFGYAELNEPDLREGIRLIGEAWKNI